jgi:hypothetical protein
MTCCVSRRAPDRTRATFRTAATSSFDELRGSGPTPRTLRRARPHRRPWPATRNAAERPSGRSAASHLSTRVRSRDGRCATSSTSVWIRCRSSDTGPVLTCANTALSVSWPRVGRKPSTSDAKWRGRVRTIRRCTLVRSAGAAVVAGEYLDGVSAKRTLAPGERRLATCGTQMAQLLKDGRCSPSAP